MAELARWNEHIFEVSPTVLRSFTNMTVKGSAETEDTTSSKEKYVKYKNSNPIELSFTVTLHAQLGIEDVRAEAMQYVQEASEGAEDFFYIGENKLMEQMMMLTSAQIDKPVMTSTGIWTHCDVKLTFKASSKENGSKGGGGGADGGTGGVPMGYLQYGGGLVPGGGSSGSSKKKKVSTKTTPTTTPKKPSTNNSESMIKKVSDIVQSVLGSQQSTAQRVSAAFKNKSSATNVSSATSNKFSQKAHD